MNSRTDTEMESDIDVEEPAENFDFLLSIQNSLSKRCVIMPACREYDFASGFARDGILDYCHFLAVSSAEDIAFLLYRKFLQ